MRTFTLSFLIFVAAVTTNFSRAQVPPPMPSTDDATQQQIDKLSAQIQDFQDAQAAQGKRLDDLEKKVSDLTDKLNQPGGGGSVSPDDLKKLSDQIQEVDKKRQSDNEAILKELEKLDKALGVAPSPHKVTTPVATASGGNTATSASGGDKQSGYYYEVRPRDTLAAIAKAYRDQHINVTTAQIIAANPGLNPNNLKVGQKIFIPDSSK